MTSAREHLYERMEASIRNSLCSYGGATQQRGLIDTEAWRGAELDALIDQVMIGLRAGLNPALESQAVEDGIAAARASGWHSPDDCAPRFAQGVLEVSTP